MTSGLRLLSICVVAGLSGAAHADPYAATGVGLGGLTLYPSLETGTVYTSNVANTPAQSGSDPDTGPASAPRRSGDRT